MDERCSYCEKIVKMKVNIIIFLKYVNISDVITAVVKRDVFFCCISDEGTIF